MYIQNSGKIAVENFSMVEAIYRILNIGLAVTNLPMEEISMNNDKVFFVVYNLFNEFREELSLSTYYFVNNFIL